MIRRPGRLALRPRLTAVLASIVATTMALAAATCFIAMSSSLRGATDDLLREQAAAVTRIKVADVTPSQLQAGLDAASSRQAGAGSTATVFQLIGADGRTALKPAGTPGFAITSSDRATVRRRRGATTLSNRTIDGERFRAITIALQTSQIQGVQIARSTEDTEAALGQLSWILLLVGLGGTAFAALTAWVLTRPIVAPTEAALAWSLAAQRQLVADASHELRTPITSLRTNAELLIRHETIDPAARDQIARELVEQCEGLAGLVGDLLDLAKEPGRFSSEPVRLDEIATTAVADIRRLHPGVTITEGVSPCLIHGSQLDLERMLRNLLENAIVHGEPAGGAAPAVDVGLNPGGVLTVRDYGRGIDAAELPQVFDRFTRGAASRGRPGSGLGLAIVKQITDAHGGSVQLRRAIAGPGTVAEVHLRPIGRR